jgi:carboxymethylenebutenolidase
MEEGLFPYSAFDYDSGVADMVSTMEAARSLSGVNGKVGLMGYCLGGLLTFITTARTGADASVVYYGGGMEKHLDVANNIRNPLMVHLGEEDEYISQDAQKAIIESLSDNTFAQVYTYPGCSHAFARHRGKHYDRIAAALANGRTADFFKLHLK